PNYLDDEGSNNLYDLDLNIESLNEVDDSDGEPMAETGLTKASNCSCACSVTCSCSCYPTCTVRY
ncbi:MAG TPA: hypothetical protein PLD60_10620, partial [Leptospiraceae bacterium]|nr:hypothetical protein [Leptospiraceae bacterium]